MKNGTVWVFYHGKPNDSELIFSRILSVPKRRIPIRNFGSPNQIREKKRNDQSRPFVWGYQNSVWRSSVWGHSESARKINSESFGILWIQIRTVQTNFGVKACSRADISFYEILKHQSGQTTLKITFSKVFFRGRCLVQRCIPPAIFAEKYLCILELSIKLYF